MYWAEQHQNGWIYRQGGTPAEGALILTKEQFEALCDERAQIINGQVVML